jgi:hypothetical protein
MRVMGIKRWLTAYALVVACLPTVASLGSSSADGTLADPEPPFAVCHEPYALCAAASCFVYNEVAYCACDLERGDSISLQLEYTTPAGTTRNVCDLDREGRSNGYLVSTFSLPSDAEKGGSGAVYTCPGSENAAGGVAAPVAYGQCDGALCFTSTVGRRFPGFASRLERDEIMCSCPISTTATSGSSGPLGYQVFGSYAPHAPPGERCDPDGCAACAVASPTANGSKIPVGAPPRTAAFLTVRLDGPPLPALNRCACRCTTADDGTASCSVASDDTP